LNASGEADEWMEKNFGSLLIVVYAHDILSGY